jgi:mRNA interferase RelE/StbE
MKAVFLGSFLKDIKKLREPKLRRAIEQAILDVEQAKAIDAIRAIKRLSGHQNYHRIRIGEWRIGLKVQEGAVHFVRCLHHRREVYRFFP